MRIEDLGLENNECLAVAAIVDGAALAWELERLCLSDEEDSLLDASRLLPIVLAHIEAARGG